MQTLKDHGADYPADHAAAGRSLRPKRRPDVRTRMVEGETVVLDRREELVHQLNRTASYIWEHCDGQTTPDEISRGLCEEFAVDYDTARKDVFATVERLRQSKLLDDS